MAKLEAGEVLDYVNALENDYAILRGEKDQHNDLTFLRAMPKLPKDLARDAQVNMLSPAILDAANIITSDLLTFPTEITRVQLATEPNGCVPQAHKRKADQLEACDAVWWTLLNPNRRLDNMVIRRQLLEPVAVIIME